jgi:hypothetical protein
MRLLVPKGEEIAIRGISSAGIDVDHCILMRAPESRIGTFKLFEAREPVSGNSHAQWMVVDC